jgi:hypothetical protein
MQEFHNDFGKMWGLLYTDKIKNANICIPHLTATQL